MKAPFFAMSPRHSAALLVVLLPFVVYVLTIAPSLGFIDSGELAAVASTLGIAHPTGYPLFTLLGWAFSRLPVGAEEIIRLNLMAVILCCGSLFFFFQVVHLFLGYVLAGQGKKGGMQGVMPAAAGATLLLAFSETFWSQAVAVEVYSLHLFFLTLLLLIFLHAVGGRLNSAHPQGESSDATDRRTWLAFAFVLGLSFTNHMTTILLAPGLLLLYFTLYRFGVGSWKRLLLMAPLFVLGLSVYLYLPVRGSQGPLFSWGDPVTLERFLWHLGGKQYRVWIFSSTEAAGKQFGYFVSTLPEEFGYAGLVLGVIGLLALLLRHRVLALTTLVLFFSCVLYSINYDIHDIDSYFLLAYVVIALWGGLGVFTVYDLLARRIVRDARVGASVVLVLCLIPLAFHFRGRDESGNYLVEDYTHDMFGSLDTNALVLSFQWDYWVSASYYTQYVRGERRDVAVVDKELLRRSWYLNELERRFPWLIAESRKEVEAFRTELAKFEHDRPYDGAVIQGRFVGMILSFLTKSMKHRPVYVTPEIEQEFTAGLQRVPQGLAYRLAADTLFHPTQRIEPAYRGFERRGRLEDMVRKLYTEAFAARGVYYYTKGGDRAEARKSLEKALFFEPGSALVHGLLAQMDAGTSVR